MALLINFGLHQLRPVRDGMPERRSLRVRTVALSMRSSARSASGSSTSRKFDSIPGVVEQVLARHGPVDILVNNAGAAWGAPAESHPADAWNKVMNLNINAVFLLTQEIGRRCMIPRKSGKIVNIASVAGLAGGPPGTTTIAYNTNKGAMLNFTRAPASELGQYNINVNAICPGWFPTKMSAGYLEKVGDKVVAGTLLHRLGREDEIKGAAVFFASEASRHVTGQYLAVDGGACIAC